MRIISRQDLIFKLIYCLLIIMTGFFLMIYSGKIIFLYLTVIFLIPACFILFNRSLRRFRSVHSDLPAGWKMTVNRYSRFYTTLDLDAKKIFEEDMKIFLKDFNITSVDSTEVDTETRLLIAIGVATILHGRRDWEPPFVDGVIVYPGETFDSDFRMNKGDIAGMAGERRPLIVTKSILKKSFEDPFDGYNSLIHEIAHYFDFENRELSGVPIIGKESGSVKEWIGIIKKERMKISSGTSFLRNYGDVNDSEFFAVATEFFFEKPMEMYEKSEDLYNILKNFYNLDMKEYLK